MPAQVAVEDLVHERGLARARDAGDADEEPERDVHRHVLEVVLASAADEEAAGRVGLPAPGRARHPEPAGEVRARLRARLLEEAGDGALVDDLAALAAGAGAEVDHVVGRGDEGRVVLDHHDRVARLGEPPQDGGEPAGVARVQAHRGLVEDVERARERAAERGGEGHALGLAAGERARLAAERQVAEAHVHEEAQPPADLVEELLRGGVASRATPPLAERALGLGHRQRLDLGEGAPVERGRGAPRP